MKLYRLLGLLVATSAFVVAANAQFQWDEAYKAQPNLAIPDNNPAGVTANILVPAGPPHRTIVSLTVDTLTRHTWQGDLKFVLITPWGAEIVLTDRPGVPPGTFGYSADNYGNPATGEKFRWDDNAQFIYDRADQGGGGPNDFTGIANVSGSWKPEQAIGAVVAGQDPSGMWGLRVSDHAGGDLGTIDNFGLNFRMVPEPASMVALGAGLIGLAARRRRK